MTPLPVFYCSSNVKARYIGSIHFSGLKSKLLDKLQTKHIHKLYLYAWR